MLRKVCPKCLIDKPFSDYSKCAARKDGVRYECKPCAVKARAEWTVKNLERSRELNRNWTRKNPEKNRAKSAAWNAANPLWKKTRDKVYAEDNKEKIREGSKAYRQKNAESVKVKNALWYAENKDRLSVLRKLRYQETKQASREYSIRFKKENRAYYNAVGRLRELKKKKATPRWLTTEHLEEMKNLYLLSEMQAADTGLAHHVDHIVPIMGKTVCGLHVPWNLQVITQEANLKKGNRLPPELLDWVYAKDE
jgi:5-methylcytosine-specific restriction endonuclease McrA